MKNKPLTPSRLSGSTARQSLSGDVDGTPDEINATIEHMNRTDTILEAPCAGCGRTPQTCTCKRPAPYGFDLSRVQVSDYGQDYKAKSLPCRFEVFALAHDPNTTTRAAWVTVANCHTVEMAKLVRAAVTFYIEERKHQGEAI